MMLFTDSSVGELVMVGDFLPFAALKLTLIAMD